MGSYYVINGSINKKALNSLKKYLYPPKFTFFLNMAIFLSGMLAFLFFLLRSSLITSIFFVGALFLYIEKIILREILIKKELNNILKPGQSVFNYKLHFYNNYLTISKETEGSGFNMDYSNISRIVETKKYIALFTRENMCFPINKIFLNENHKYEWLDYVVERNNKIKLYNIQ